MDENVAEIGQTPEVVKSKETETLNEQIVKTISPDFRKVFLENEAQLRRCQEALAKGEDLTQEERTIYLKNARMCSVYMGNELPGYKGLTDEQKDNVRSTLMGTYRITAGGHYSPRGGDEHFAGFEIAPNQQAVVDSATVFLEKTGPEKLRALFAEMGIERQITSKDMADFVWVTVGRDLSQDVPLTYFHGKVINRASAEVVGGAVLGLEAKNLLDNFKAEDKLPLLVEDLQGNQPVEVGKKRTKYNINTVSRTQVADILSTQQMKKMEEEQVLTQAEIDLLADISFDTYYSPRTLFAQMMTDQQRADLGNKEVKIKLDDATYARQQIDIYTSETERPEMSVGGIDITGYSQMGADIEALKSVGDDRGSKFERTLQNLMGQWHEQMIISFEKANLEYGESGGDGAIGLGQSKTNEDYFKSVIATIETGQAWGKILSQAEAGESGQEMKDYVTFVRQKFAEKGEEMPWAKGACVKTPAEVNIFAGKNFTPVTIRVPNPLEGMKYGQDKAKSYFQSLRKEVKITSSVWLGQPKEDLLTELENFLSQQGTSIFLVKDEGLGGYFAVTAE